MVSEIFDASAWTEIPGFDLQDLTYHRAKDQGTVRVAFNRPEVRNAFRPNTVDEIYKALDHARQWSDVGCVLLTGNGPSPKDAGWAFCSGGDQRIRGKDGYKYEGAEESKVDPARGGEMTKTRDMGTTVPRAAARRTAESRRARSSRAPSACRCGLAP